MGRRIIRNTENTKSFFDSFLIPIIRLFVKESKNQTATDADSKTFYLSETEKEKPSVKSDNYIEQVLKYIPSEIVAAYLFLEGILKSSTKTTELFFWIVFFFMLVVTPFYIWALTSEKDENTGKTRKPAWDQIIISFFSFAVWVFAIGGPFASLPWYDSIYGSTLLVLFTFMPPIISKILCRTSIIICSQSGNSMKT